MPLLPSPTDDYKAPADMALSRAAWDAALVSIGTRLRALEAVQADFDALIALGTSQALEVIATNVEPQLTAMTAAVAALQADVAEAEDVITALTSGSVPASAVSETADRIWLTPALLAAWNAKQAGAPTLTALAALTVAADKLIYATGADAFATSDISAFARTLLAGIDAAAMRATLGAAYSGRTISAGGLASGGGDLTENRTITVPVADQTEAEAGDINDKAMTPLRVAQQIDADPDLGPKLAAGSLTNAGALAIDLSAYIAAGRRKFWLKLHNLRVASSTSDLVALVSTDAGVNWIGTNYRWTLLTAYDGGAGRVYGDTTGTGTDVRIQLAGYLGAAPGNTVEGWIEIECASDYFDLVADLGAYGQADGAFSAHVHGKAPSGDVNAIRIAATTGNLASVAWTLYGGA